MHNINMDGTDAFCFLKGLGSPPGRLAVGLERLRAAQGKRDAGLRAAQASAPARTRRGSGRSKEPWTQKLDETTAEVKAYQTQVGRLDQLVAGNLGGLRYYPRVPQRPRAPDRDDGREKTRLGHAVCHARRSHTFWFILVAILSHIAV